MVDHTNHASGAQDRDRFSGEPFFDSDTALCEFFGDDLESAILGIQTFLGFVLSLEFPQDLYIGTAIEEDAETGCEFSCELLVEEDVGAEVYEDRGAEGKPVCEFRVGLGDGEGGQENWSCTCDSRGDPEWKLGFRG